ncbi:MAG: hypothetical protein Q8Q91_02290 [Candidatus Daviesbacteria bacterium]|nr:hypothetical protein [Candidatus Daviesbacteria bacterium]
MAVNLFPFLMVFTFTTLNEAIVEYLCGSVKALKPYLSLISLTVAILLTFSFKVSIFNIFFDNPVTHPFMEFLLSALLIARLSNYLNDFVQKFLGSK